MVLISPYIVYLELKFTIKQNMFKKPCDKYSTYIADSASEHNKGKILFTQYSQ